MCDNDPADTFGYAMKRWAPSASPTCTWSRPPRPCRRSGWTTSAAPRRWPARCYPGTIITAGEYDRDAAERGGHGGRADLVAFARQYLANPDLAERFRVGAELNDGDQATFYGGGAEGYTDYPTLDAS